MGEVGSFQRRLFASYQGSLTLPPHYAYLWGNPVRTLVPLDTAQDGVMIVGAYSTARFATLNGESDVPVGDIGGPFADKAYFDGARVRTVASGHELEAGYLCPLGLSRTQCWITNLVKVFLFKNGHIERYRRLGCDWPARETRSQFEELARQGLGWLLEELELARPRLIITLGREVAGVLQGVHGARARVALLGGERRVLWLDDVGYPAIHLAHPGIVMCPESAANPWSRLHRDEHVPMAREMVQALLA